MQITTYSCPGCALYNIRGCHRAHGVIQCVNNITVWKLCQSGNSITMEALPFGNNFIIQSWKVAYY